MCICLCQYFIDNRFSAFVFAFFCCVLRLIVIVYVSDFGEVQYKAGGGSDEFLYHICERHV